MKRAILSLGAVVLAGGVAACSPTPPEKTADEAEAAREWARPPAIAKVERAGAALAVSGVADPGARVVLRGDNGAAFAATADSNGHFEVRVPRQVGHVVLRPETQVGQDAAASPDRLLILEGGEGPVAVLRPGGATRRLDAAPALGAVDSDGRMRLASGRVTAETRTIEVQNGEETVQVVPDSRGRWNVILPPRDGPDAIRVAGREFLWPGDAGGPRDFAVERLASGWRIRWTGPGAARQTTWLPDPAGR